jgi:hypothetical protein
MTAYCVTNLGNTSGGTVLGINAGLYEIKIDRVDYFYLVPGGGYAAQFNPMYRSSVPLTGGTATPIAPLRAASPPASATAMCGASMVHSGGVKNYVAQIYITGAGAAVATNSGSSPYPESSGGSTSFSFPSDLTISPGGSFEVDNLYGPLNGFTTAATVYFEELRLSQSY